jgi:phosphoribosyl-ATP pyrophosphohydrolase/phosphoribosyl-AMP cyclohydrolase
MRENLTEQNLTEQVDWLKCGDLVPAIIQDSKTLEVLMLGFMNREAVNLSQKTQKVHFWSRTKNRIWMKGEESGNILNIVDIKLDCDNDSLLVLVKPIGNTCHNGSKSCFNLRANFIAELEKIIENRIKSPSEASYVSKLTQKGLNKVVQKIGEEATEVVIAALSETNQKLVEESADLLFHLIITLKMKNLKLDDVIDLLKQRNKSVILTNKT